MEGSFKTTNANFFPDSGILNVSLKMYNNIIYELYDFEQKVSGWFLFSVDYFLVRKLAWKRLGVE